MTLVQLRHLVALAQTGSFSKAAQAQFLTQPALSRSIRALEDDLGLALFDRVGRRIELTPFGRETLARAHQLLSDADELQGSGQRLRDGHGGVLRIGMVSGPGAMLMTPLLMQMARERPRLHVEIARAGTDLLVQALRTRALDALVVDARSLRPAPDLHAEFLHEMRGAFVAPLAAQDTTTAPAAAAPPAAGTLAPQDTVVYPKPPVTPMGAFFRSLLLPGWSQSILDRRLTAGLFMAVEGLAIGMVLKSASELSYLRQYDPAKVDAKDQEREDWIAVLAFNHLFAALEGYVGAHLWDFPQDVKIRAVPWRGGGIGAAVTIPLRRR